MNEKVLDDAVVRVADSPDEIGRKADNMTTFTTISVVFPTVPTIAEMTDADLLHAAAMEGTYRFLDADEENIYEFSK